MTAITFDHAEAISKQAKKARSLLVASAKKSYNPRIDIDWDAPLEPGKWFLTEKRCSLYGTDLWNSLSMEQKLICSREELAASFALGVWTEFMLLQMVARYVYDREITSPQVQYALTESADEVRHMIMFSDLTEKMGANVYKIPFRTRESGRLLKFLAPVPWLWALLMLTEKIFDKFQREMAADESVQPVVRSMSRIHVVEEARHISFAQSELEVFLPKISKAQRFALQMVLALTVKTLSTEVFNPEMYRRAGLDPKVARRTALNNPNNAATFKWAAEEIAPYYQSIGLIDGLSEKIWKQAGFL